MNNTILFEGQEMLVQQTDLPMLIHGAEGYGASLFSVSVIANLYAQGANIIFLSGYEMAKDEFFKQTNAQDYTVTVHEGFSAQDIALARVIIVPTTAPELLHTVLQMLPDPTKYVVFFKNFDLFTEGVFLAVQNTQRLVLMGNIDNCVYVKSLLTYTWASRVYFSVPSIPGLLNVPAVQKYTGYLHSINKTGVVSVA